MSTQATQHELETLKHFDFKHWSSDILTVHFKPVEHFGLMV